MLANVYRQFISNPVWATNNTPNLLLGNMRLGVIAFIA